MSKTTLFITLVPAILMIIWLTVIALLLLTRTTDHLTVLILATPLFIGISIYLHYSLVLGNRIRTIKRVADEIEKRIHESSSHIDESKAPKEIRPIISALNRLLSYEEDRYNQERDFTANASHELRTPLAGIRLQTQIALRTKDTKQRKKAFRNILKSIDRATRLVEQLLTLSRLTADRVDLDMSSFALEKLTAQVITDLAPLTEDKQITVKHTKSRKALITANEETISILIHNLIRNAIIYTPTGGYVHIIVKRLEDRVLLTVTDTGPGIALEKRTHVMQRFKKAESGTKTGTGLGLAIVKRVADLHHATVELSNNETHGHGLKVTVIFKTMPIKKS